MSDQDSGDGKPKYAVGYRRPPVDRQFKPGQSGNPKGRRRGVKNFATTLAEVLNEKIAVRDKNGRRRWITKQQAMCERTTNAAVLGDTKAFLSIVQVADKHGVFKHQEESSSFHLDSALRKLSERIGRLAPHAPAEDETAPKENQNDDSPPDSKKEK
jgi:hypothetical protein